MRREAKQAQRRASMNQKRYERLEVTLVIKAIEGGSSCELLALTHGFQNNSIPDALLHLIEGIKGESE